MQDAGENRERVGKERAREEGGKQREERKCKTEGGKTERENERESGCGVV